MGNNMKRYKYSAFGDEISDDFMTQIDVLEKYAIPAIDIRSVNKKNVLDLSYEEIYAIKYILKQKCIEVASIASPIGKSKIDTPFCEIKAQLNRAIQVAKILHCHTIRIFSFYSDGISSKENLIVKSIERLKIMSDIARQNGILLSLENERNTIADDPIIARHILDVIGDENLSAVFDFANYVRSGFNTLNAYELLRKYITAFHMKDAVYNKDMVVPCGLGDGNLREVLYLLQNDEDFSGFFSIEPHLKQYFEFNDRKTQYLEEKGNDSIEMFSIAYLACKKLINDVEGR